MSGGPDERSRVKSGRVTLGTTPPRGMRDVLPAEVELRDAAAQQIVTVYRSYGFRRIETPALESLPLLIGSEGGENEKLIFKVLKRGEDLEAALRQDGRELADLGLRYDLTVPLARYYAENHAQLPDPLKAIQIGPVWRAERPQKGRFRQFTQCDIDVLGVASPVVEIELILATSEALARAGPRPTSPCASTIAASSPLIARHCGIDERAPGRVLHHLRQAGQDRRATASCASCARPATTQRAVDALRAAAAHAGRRADPPLRRLRACSAREAPGEAFDWLATIIRTASGDLPAGTRVAFDPTLVRGMGYYTGTIFEIVVAGLPVVHRWRRAIRSDGGQVARAGRPGLRILDRLRARDPDPRGSGRRGHARSRSARGGAADSPSGRRPRRLAAALAAARRLRGEGYLVSVELRRKNFGKQLDDFARHGFWGFAAPDGRRRAHREAAHAARQERG